MERAIDPEIAELHRDVRATGISDAALAREAGLSRVTLGRAWRGETSPTRDTVKAIRAALRRVKQLRCEL